ncbi:hypothetical protein DYB31_008627 [Aphanomyces astaci]|uniref:SET domain-containing protein n=1 Tax=Aphanomyces astaci TaxID=112090 RepID=A0A397F1Y0_APHAT|nr:hypothetical protein DYB31_008627 [Aphanomyces astaci]
MAKKRFTYNEKLECVNALTAHVKEVDDVVKATMCGVSTIYKWIAERAAIEQHVKHGFGDKVRVVVKSYARKQKVVRATPSRYAPRAPREPIDEVRRVLEWLAGSPSGSVSLKELVHQFSIVPQFPDKSIQAQVAFVRRMVRAHALHGHVSFKIKRHTGNPTDSGSSPPPPPQEQSRYEMPSFSIAPPMHQAPARPLAPQVLELPSMPTMPPLAAWLDEPSDDNDDNLSDIGVDSVDLLDVLLQDYDCMSDSELSEADAVPKCASEVDRLNKSCISISSTDPDDTPDDPTPILNESCFDDVTSVEPPPCFNYVDSNVYRGDLRLTHSHRNLAELKRCPVNALCECWRINNRFREPMCNTNNCINVTNNNACPLHCRMGTLCANQGFDKDSAVKHSLFRTTDKGFGLRLDVAVHAGQHIMEYVGEVIGKDEFFRRFRNMSYAQVPDYYFMQLSPSTYVDAKVYGNNSRFINHSCEPNCIAEVWTLHGEKRIAITAMTNIDADVEVTFNYKWSTQAKTNTFPCKCGSAKCCGRM